MHINDFLAVLSRNQALVGTRFIDHIDRLVRHMLVIDIAVGQFRRRTQGFVGVFNLVMLFKA